MTEKKSRNARRNYVESKALQAFLDRHDIDTNDASKALRIHAGSIRKYLKDGGMPAYVLTCIEAIDRRSRGEIRISKVSAIFVTDTEKMDLLKNMAKAMKGIKITDLDL